MERQKFVSHQWPVIMQRSIFQITIYFPLTSVEREVGTTEIDINFENVAYNRLAEKIVSGRLLSQ